MPIETTESILSEDYLRYRKKNKPDFDWRRKEWVELEKLRKRIEWLMQEISNLYHKVGDTKADVWRAGNDEVCDMCEEYVLKKVNDALGVYVAKSQAPAKFVNVDEIRKEILEEIKPRIVDVLHSKGWDALLIEQFVKDVLNKTLQKLKR